MVGGGEMGTVEQMQQVLSSGSRSLSGRRLWVAAWKAWLEGYLLLNELLQTFFADSCAPLQGAYRAATGHPGICMSV